MGSQKGKSPDHRLRSQSCLLYTSLMERFGLTDEQSQAIVDMRLKALTGLEREKLEAEYKAVSYTHLDVYKRQL